MFHRLFSISIICTSFSFVFSYDFLLNSSVSTPTDYFSVMTLILLSQVEVAVVLALAQHIHPFGVVGVTLCCQGSQEH